MLKVTLELNEMKYIVLYSNDPYQLSKMVMARLTDGWVLQGGVAISNSRDQGQTLSEYAQAMIKDESVQK